MAVPYTFGTATSSIPLSQLDSNFNTVITLGNTAIQLGNTVTTLNNMTLANVTISSGNVTITNVAITTANVTTANITTAVIGTETVTTSTITTANVTTANITTDNITNGTVITSLTLSYGTANGVAYLNGSKVLTTGSALTFDGTNLGVGGSLNTSAGRVALTLNATTDTILSFGRGGTSVGFILQDTGGQTFYNGENTYQRFYVNASEQMRLTSTGLGIGTNSPSGLLHISGVSTGNQLFLERTGTATGKWNLYVQSNGLYFRDTVAAADRMIINSSGIVTMSAYGAGAATFSAAGVISSVSDETWKIKDGVPVDPDAMLKKLKPGYWYYNDEKKEIFGVDRQLGFYAQNVNAAIGPEAAPTPEEGKPWGYYDRSVLAVTVMSLQKALATIESLTARITALEST
jgi:hypothetical protein